MATKTRKRIGKKALLRVRFEKQDGWLTTHVGINKNVDVAAEDGYLCFWIAGREVKVGPLTKEQSSKLAEDLEYESVE